MELSQIFRKPYIFWLIGIFIVYLLINIFVSGFYNTIPLIINYVDTVNLFKLSLSLIFSIFIGILVSINAVISYLKYKERKKCKEGIALGTLGTIGGLAVGVCPLCITGIFPLILSFLGISFSFASLPFDGIEVQLFVIFLLSAGLYLLKGD